MLPVDELNRFATPAQRRLIFEEAFLFQMGVLARRRAAAAEQKPAPITRRRSHPRVGAGGAAVQADRRPAQALKEIVDDLQRPQPMNRLLQGDVGAGKTIVALLAALVAMENGLQVAFMAPTEILAEQHFVEHLAAAAGVAVPRRAADRLDGRGRARREQLAEVEAGTHAPGRRHARAGPGRRARSSSSGWSSSTSSTGSASCSGRRCATKGLHPDVLVMTATPIPRTLALTLYGDLDVSVIRDLPPGRLPVRTIAKPESRRDEIYEFVRERARGRPAGVRRSIRSSRSRPRSISRPRPRWPITSRRRSFPEYRVGLLHGRMKADGKERVMKAFAAGELQILVSTTVVEVGVDVPNASVMIVEHAERFGLSQLHQLRGRVGRDRHQSYCCLLYQSPLSDEARERLKAMTDTTDGFEIAERDLRAARPGRFLRHAPGGHADVPPDRSRARSRAARARAARGGALARAVGADAGDARQLLETGNAVQADRDRVIG